MSRSDEERKLADSFDDPEFLAALESPAARDFMRQRATELRWKADERDNLEALAADDAPGADYRIVSFGHDLLGCVEFLSLAEGETYTDEQADGIIRQAAHWIRQVVDRHATPADPETIRAIRARKDAS